jgi:DNA-binding winged helix-turn-helix (wHTH) protein
MPQQKLATVDLNFSQSHSLIRYGDRPVRVERGRECLEIETVTPGNREPSIQAPYAVVAGPWSVRPNAMAADQGGALAATAMSFGPFQILPNQRLLLEEGRPLHLGSRALDILVALVERAGELVSKAELMARVWPGIFVDAGNLKVQVAALRRALRDGEDGNRYIFTVAGRGYWFVAPVGRTTRVHGDGPG